MVGTGGTGGRGNAGNPSESPSGGQPRWRRTGGGTGLVAAVLRGGVALAMAILGLGTAAVFSVATATPAFAGNNPDCPTVGAGGVVSPPPTQFADWAYCDLAGADLSDIGGTLGSPAPNLTDVDFYDSNLTDVTMEDSSAEGIDLGDANITGANFTGTDLTSVLSGGTNYTSPPTLPYNWSFNVAGGYLLGPGADYLQDDLAGLNLSNADLEGAYFYQADLQGTELEGDNLYDADFEGDNMTSADLSPGTSGDTDLQHTILQSADLTDADLTDAQFGLTNAEGANLSGANLSGAALAHSDLTNATLTGVDLNGTSSGDDYYYYGASETSGTSGLTGSPTLSSPYTLYDGYLVGPYTNLTDAYFGFATPIDDGLFDLAYANLTGDNLSGANLNDAQVSGTAVNLTDASLYDSTISGVDLSHAVLTGVSSGGITGPPAALPGSWVFEDGFLLGPGADLAFDDLANLDLQGVDLAGADLYGASSGGITGTPTALPADWELVDGYLIGPDADLAGAELSGAELQDADLDNANLTGADLTGANLTDANLTGANLTDADLVGATVTGAQVGGADLQGANLTGLDLAGFTLTGDNLSGADLNGAALSGAALSGADLSGTDLSGANLSGADLDGATSTTATNFNGVTWSNTTCPDGSNSNADGGACLNAVSTATASGGPGETVAGSGPVTATGSGGSAGDTLSEVLYGSSPPAGVGGLSNSTSYFGVSAGSSFSSVTIQDCEDITPSSAIEWWNSSTDSWEPVESPATETAFPYGQVPVTGPPACVSVTIDGSSNVTPSQLAGGVFGIASVYTPGGSVTLSKSSGLIGNTTIKVSGQGWNAHNDPSVTIYQCATNTYAAASCDQSTAAIGAVLTTPASEVGNVPNTVITLKVGTIDTSGDTCGLPSSPTCYIVVVGSGPTADSTATPLAFATPTVTVSKTTGVVGNSVDNVTAKNFPAGDTVTAEECDGAATLATLTTHCDSATEITGMAAANGTVTFSPAGVTMAVGNDYGDGAGGTCATGGSCKVEATDVSTSSAGISGSISLATPTLTLAKTTGVVGNYVDRVTAKDFPVGDNVSVYECDDAATPSTIASNCDAAWTASGAAGATGTVMFTTLGVPMAVGDSYLDGAGGHCSPGGTCIVVADDSANPAVGAVSAQVTFAVPTITLSKTTGVTNGTVDKITAKYFPIGDSIAAEQCDSAATVATLSTNCDSATTINGSAGATGSVVFSPNGVTMLVGGGYSDLAGGTCNAGGSCLIAVTDSSNAAINVLSGSIGLT